MGLGRGRRAPGWGGGPHRRSLRPVSGLTSLDGPSSHGAGTAVTDRPHGRSGPTRTCLPLRGQHRLAAWPRPVSRFTRARCAPRTPGDGLCPAPCAGRGLLHRKAEGRPGTEGAADREKPDHASGMLHGAWPAHDKPAGPAQAAPGPARPQAGSKTAGSSRRRQAATSTWAGQRRFRWCQAPGRRWKGRSSREFRPPKLSSAPRNWWRWR